jgi:hypothetical protein
VSGFDFTEDALSAALVAEAEGCLPGVPLEEILAATGPWNRAWIAWAALTAVSFAGLEYAAIRSAPGHGTLSALLRRRRRASGIAIAAGAAWLVHHIVWQEVER